MTSDDVFQDAGDSACWLGRVCECGALVEGPRGVACWRCGSVLPAEEER